MKETREIIPAPIRDANELERPFEPQIVPTGHYPGYRGAYAETEGFQLLDYWRAIRKRLWLVVGITVLVTTWAAIYMARKPNIYQARAVVQVDLEQTNPDLVTTERQRPLANRSANGCESIGLSGVRQKERQPSRVLPKLVAFRRKPPRRSASVATRTG